MTRKLLIPAKFKAKSGIARNFPPSKFSTRTVYIAETRQFREWTDELKDAFHLFSPSLLTNSIQPLPLDWLVGTNHHLLGLVYHMLM